MSGWRSGTLGRYAAGLDRATAAVADHARQGGVEALLLVALVALYPFHAVVDVGPMPFNVSLGDPVVALVGGLWLIGLVGTHRLPRYVLPVGAFGAVAVASIVVVGLLDPAYFSATAGVGRLAKLLGSVAWMVAVYVLVRRDPDRLLPVGAVASVAVAAALGVWMVYLGYVVGVDRVAWPFENPNLLGNYLLLNVCLGGYAWRSRLRGTRTASVGVLVPALVVLVLATVATGSRGALVGLAVAATAAVVLSEGVGWREFLAGVAAVGSSGAIAVLVLLQRNPVVVTRTVSTKNVGSRIDLWTVAGQGFASNPLLGIGYGQFPWYLPTRIPGWSTGVHNTYLLLAAEVGLVGLVAFLAIVAFAVRDGIELGRRYPAVVFLVAFVLGTFGQAIGTDVDNFRSLWLALGAVAAYADRYGAAKLPYADRVPLVETAAGGSTAAGRPGTTVGDEQAPVPRTSTRGTGDQGDPAADGSGLGTGPGDTSEGRAGARSSVEATDAPARGVEPSGRRSAEGQDAGRDSGRTTAPAASEASPAVSVVITTYNEAAYIEDALDAIAAQTLADVEVVVVDDGSTDDTVERIRGHAADGVWLVERGRLGRSAALNCAIGHASAEYVAIVDPDDPSRPDRLETQYRFLESHPEVGAVGSAYEAVDRVRDERYVRRYPTAHEDIVAAMPKYIPLAHSSMMARTAAVEAVGGYDESLDAIVDLDLLVRLGRRYRLANVDEPLIRREIRPDSSFHTMYTPLRRRLRLFRLSAAAVDAFDLPWHYRAYPPLHLVYAVLPSRCKRVIRRRFSDIREDP